MVAILSCWFGTLAKRSTTLLIQVVCSDIIPNTQLITPWVSGVGGIRDQECHAPRDYNNRCDDVDFNWTSAVSPLSLWSGLRRLHYKASFSMNHVGSYWRLTMHQILFPYNVYMTCIGLWVLLQATILEYFTRIAPTIFTVHIIPIFQWGVSSEISQVKRYSTSIFLIHVINQRSGRY